MQIRKQILGIVAATSIDQKILFGAKFKGDVVNITLKLCIENKVLALIRPELARFTTMSL